MTMYRIQPGDRRLQAFRSSQSNVHYLERDLESWLEANPEVLTDGEPVLMIGRQISTALGGTLDLMGLDAEGATIIVELKRAPTPRDIIAQAIEYGAWLASLDDSSVRMLADEYLTKRTPPVSL